MIQNVGAWLYLLSVYECGIKCALHESWARFLLWAALNMKVPMCHPAEQELLVEQLCLTADNVWIGMAVGGRIGDPGTYWKKEL